jgi:outer membrane protein OmpA-like peptidoglycan-associated protein
LDGTPPVLSIVAETDLFSPDDDGYQDTIFFTNTCSDFSPISQWSFSVYKVEKNGSETLIRTISGKGTPPPRIEWDGKDDKGSVLPQLNKFSYALSAVDMPGNSNLTSRLEIKKYIESDLYLIKVKDGWKVIVDGVEFDTAKADIRTNSYWILDRAVGVLNRPLVKGHPVLVDGHTDDRSSDAFNLTLSSNRAISVGEYLANGGIPASILGHRGFGESSPVVSNSTEEGRQKNRRVELFIDGKKEISGSTETIIENKNK